MLSLSSIILAKNEEKNIKRCIESQIGVIDEIIVVIDSSTTDKTEEFVDQFPGVKKLITDWQGYAKTKQIAVGATTNDWIFWIDADEAITQELQTELLKWKTEIPSSGVYSVPRKAWFLGRWIKHCGWYPGRVPRLFNKNEVTFNDNLVHEGLDYKGTPGELINPLDHFTDPSSEHYYNKFNHYTTLAANQLYQKGKKGGIFSAYIRALSVFLKMYFLKLGFLDGAQGFILSFYSMNYVFTKYVKLWERNDSRHNS
ncbi:glycosyltransferase family 2 protein [Ignavibacteriales bacterium]